MKVIIYARGWPVAFSDRFLFKCLKMKTSSRYTDNGFRLCAFLINVYVWKELQKYLQLSYSLSPFCLLFYFSAFGKLFVIYQRLFRKWKWIRFSWTYTHSYLPTLTRCGKIVQTIRRLGQSKQFFTRLESLKNKRSVMLIFLRWILLYVCCLVNCHI